MRQIFDPMLQFLDKDRPCSDPALPHTKSLEDVCVPRARKHPNFVAFFLKFHDAAPVQLFPADAARQNPRIHHIQDD